MLLLAPALILQSGLLASQRAKLPQQVDLSPRFTELKLPICRQNGPWCWAYTTIGVLEYEEASRLGHRFQLSPGFLTWAAQETDSQGSGGSNFGRADRGLEQYGAVSLESGGIPPSGGRIPAPADDIIKAGQNFDDLNFHWIRFWNRKQMSDQQLITIKGDIAQGHPVAVGMQWPNNTSFVSGTKILKVPDHADVFDGHCVILVGYTDDPTVPGGGSFLFRNSWGANWGDHGYARMPYELLGFCINDAYSVRITPKANSAEGPIQTIAADDLTPTDISPTATINRQSMRRFGNAWGDHKQITFRTSTVGDGFTVEVPVDKSGAYDVRLVITRAQIYGEFTVTLPDKKNTPTIQGAGPGVSRSRPISLGIHRLQKGTQPIRFTITGMSSASSGMNLGLCEVHLVPKT